MTGTAGSDTISGDNTTLQATDVINGGAGTDTFTYTDARSTAVAGDAVPAALVSAVEVINIRNVNGTAAVAGVTETATLTFSALAAGQTITIDGVTLTGGTGGSTAAQVAAAFFANTNATAGAGGAVGHAGALTNYSMGATQPTATSVTISSSVAGNVTDLTTGGTGAQPVISIVQGVAAVTSTGANIVAAAGNYAGATEFNSTNSLNKVTFTGLSDAQSVGIVGNGTVSNGDVDYTLAATATKTTINVKDGTKQGTVTNTGATVTTATINSTGAANTLTAIDLGTGTNVTALTINAATNLVGTTGNSGMVNLAADYAATSTLTVAGAASSVALGNGSAATFKTIDASGLTAGGLTIALSTTATSFKGGQGNDVLTTAAVASTAAIDAGAGTADVVVVNAASDVDTAAKAGLYKGFEIARLSDSQDMALFTGSTITGIQMNAANSKTLTNVTVDQAANLTVRGDQGMAFTVTLANATGTADVVNLTMSNPTATATAPADVDIAGLSVAGVETLNITSSGGGVDLTNAGTLNSLTFASGGADKLKTITVAGASSLDVSLAHTAVAVALTSTQTGTANLKVAGDVVKGSSITTTANKDDITITTAAAGSAGDYITYNAGANDDAISGTIAGINNTSNSNASVKIDGGDGTDTLTLTETNLSAVDANFQYLTNIEKITHTATGTVSISTGGFFDTNFKTNGVTFTLGETTNGAARSLDASSFTGKVTATVSNHAAGNVSTVKTGSGNDTITLTQSATVNTTTHVVEAGQGDDTISAANSFVSVTGGRGADTITITDTSAARDTIVIAAGDSNATGRDKVTGFAITNAATSDQLDLAGTFALLSATTGLDGTDSGVIKSHALTAGGIITFAENNAFATAVTINSTKLADALGYIAANFTTAGTTMAFAYDSNNDGSADATIVYQVAATVADSTVVELVGVTGVTALAATAAASTVIVI